MEIIKGEVQNIKGNNFTINNLGYNNKFKKLPEGFKKGSIVEVSYITKNNKNFWQNIIIEEEVKPLYVEDDILANKELKPIYMSEQQLKDEREYFELKEKIPNQTVNTILMNVNSIILKELELGNKFTQEELICKSEILTKMYLQNYKIINSLA